MILHHLIVPGMMQLLLSFRRYVTARLFEKTVHLHESSSTNLTFLQVYVSSFSVNLCLSLSKRKWEGGAKHSRAFFHDVLLAREPFIQASVRLKQLLFFKRAISDISTILSLVCGFLTIYSVPNEILVIFMLWMLLKIHESASHHFNYLNDSFGTRIPSILPLTHISHGSLKIHIIS